MNAPKVRMTLWDLMVESGITELMGTDFDTSPEVGVKSIKAFAQSTYVSVDVGAEMCDMLDGDDFGVVDIVRVGDYMTIMCEVNPEASDG